MRRTQGAFVVGTGRCGSTLLSTLLRDYSRALSLSEFFSLLGGRDAFVRGPTDGATLWDALNTPKPEVAEILDAVPAIPELLPPRSMVTPIIARATLPHLTAEPDALWSRMDTEIRRLPGSTPAQLYSAFFQYLQREYGRDYWVERSGGSLEYVEQIIATWPKAKYVHLFRAGPDCALSMSRHPYFKLRVARLSAGNPALPVSSSLVSEIPVERFGAYWSAVMIHGLGALSKLPADQVLHVDYADLVRRPFNALERIVGFIGDDLVTAPAHEVDSRVAQSRPTAKAAGDAYRAAERYCRPGQRALERILGRAP